MRGLHEQGKPIAFVCHAGWVPVSAAIVGGRRVTLVLGIAVGVEKAVAAG